MYVQCKLVKIIENGEQTLISWIPKKFAIIGNILQLKEKQAWEGGWRVEEVYGDNVIENIPNVRASIKRHRKNTGDSLPKEKS